MSIIGSNILAGASGQAADSYRIERSLRFNSADDAHLTRTPSSAGNRKTWTWSGWVKRSKLGVQQVLFMCEINFGEFAQISFNSSDQLQSYLDDDGSGGYVTNPTSAVFRDVSAWYHVVWAVDSTKATASDRVKLYVNGVDQSYTGGNIPQDGNHAINSTTAHSIGIRLYNSTVELDAYLAEVHFIDGQALAASDFGKYDNSDNVWQPKEYSGTYGTNGFYLDFSDNTSTTTITEDSSGNSNDWTANNLSVASGAANDSLIDTPTNYTASSGNNGGNYCTINPLDSSSTSTTTSEGNLKANIHSNSSIRGSFYVSSGKWYYEVTVNTLNNLYLGLAANGGQPASYSTSQAFGVNNAGDIYKNGSNTGTNSVALAASSTFGIAFDADNQLFWLAKDGQWYSADASTASTINVSEVVAGTSGYDFSSLSGDKYAPHFGNSDTAGADITVNFGQRSFEYTPPTGYLSLCTQNLSESAYASIPDGSDHFDIALDTGANILSSTKALCGSGADFLWIKDRATNTTNNILIDIVRDTQLDGTPFLSSNSTSSESTLGTYSAPSGNSVGWAWEAGTSTASNTDGTITSSVRANQTAGFSIATYTGTGSNATFGHGLNAAAPEWILIKRRDSTQNWAAYHQSISGMSGGYLHFNLTNKFNTSYTAVWNDTDPTSSVVSIGTDAEVNANTATYVAYCWAPVEGYSAFGIYTGNGDADGPFVFTGMRPKWILIKESSHDGNNWNIFDTERNAANVVNLQLKASSDSNESTNAFADYLSNGFKIRVSTAGINTDTRSYIYAAFAEHPFRHARAR